MNGGDKGSGILGISSGDAAPSLQVKERIFHQVTQFVKVTVVVTLGIPVLPGRDDSFDARSLCEGDDPVGVIPPISEQVLCGKAFYQLSCNCAIRCGTRCNKESYEALFWDMREAGWRSHDDGTYGLYVHISLKAMERKNPSAVHNLLILADRFWDELVRFSRRTQIQLDKWANRYAAKGKPYR